MSELLCSWRRKVAVVAAGAVVAAVGVLGAGGAAVLAAPPASAQPLIVGGDEVDTAPSWAVSVGPDPDFALCSGALVASRWVLTASTCSDNADFVRIGSKYTYEGGTGGKVVGTRWPTERWPDLVGYDLVLLKLRSPVDNKPLKLGSASPQPGAAVTAYGYGVTCPSMGSGCFDTATTLRTLDTTVLADEDCGAAGVEPTGQWEFCVQASTAVTPCYLDDGGPLLMNGRMVGMDSRPGDDDPDLPAVACGYMNQVFSDVTYARDWIESVTND